jgi:iron complex outermembrane recepter protein
MKRSRYVASLASAGTIVLASLASAQTAQNPPTGGGAAPQPATGEIQLQEVTVTGSRIIQNGLDSPTPVTSINMGAMSELQPTTVADQLNDLPSFSGSRNQFTNASTGNLGTGPAAPNPSANVLNLRNMGYLRTLVLYDGKRVPPTSPDGTTDVNMIPQMLLQRVDVVTGGASAVYGSDAVTGVVNFITDTRFTGLKVQANAGISGDHDDRTYDQGVAWGKDLFGGRGHVEMSVENRSDPGILYRSQRAWGRDVWTVQGAGTAADPYNLVENTRIGTSAFGGLITSGPLAGQQFTSDGYLTPCVTGAPTGTKGIYSGGCGAYNNSSFAASLQMDQAFARMDYDFSDSVHGDVTLAATYNHNAAVGSDNILSNVTLSAQNPYLAAEYQNALAAAGQSTFKLSEYLQNFPETTETWTRNYWANAELQGSFGRNYHWDAWYTHSESRQDTRLDDNINDQNLAAALDAVIDPATGQPVCNATLASPGSDPGCVPLDVLGTNAASQAALDYVVQPTEFLSTQKMDDVSGSVTGAPFHDWAGPVHLALDAEWRYLSWELDSDANPNAAANCAGIQYNCTSSTLLWADGATPSRSPVSETVAEGALEFDAPLLANLPLARNVSVNGAARFTRYSQSGSAVTWKAGLVWHLNDQLTFRAARSRDIRAPSLYELYFPRSVNYTVITDLLTGLSPQVPSYNGGNPNLTPEVGYTSTAGLVFQPAWAPGLALTLDGFWINITNAITNLQGTNPTVQAECYASGGNSPYCQLQQRPDGFTNTSAANEVTAWYNEYINISSQSTSGADLDATYMTRAFHRPLKLRALGTFQPHIIYNTPGLTTVDLGGVAFSSNALQASPVWRATFMADYQPVHGFSIDVMERWRSSLAWTGDPTQVVSVPRIPSVAYTDLNLAYLFDGSDSTTEVYLNVQNLFDKPPPPAAFLGANGNPGGFGGFVFGDDPIGTYVTLGVRYRR